MTQWYGRSAIAMVAVVVGMGAIGGGWTTDLMARAPQGARPSDPGVAQRADVTIRFQRIKADGTPHPAQAPLMTMRFERRLEGGRWRSSIVIPEAERPKAMFGDTPVELSNPFRVARVDFDDESGEATAYDTRGRQVSSPTAADRAEIAIDRELTAKFPHLPKVEVGVPKGQAVKPWLGLAAGDLVLRGRDVDARRQALVLKLGPSKGRLRGLDRHVETAGDEVTEVLVDPLAALPVEVNTVARGALQSRTEMRYTPFGADGRIRELVRTERALAGGSDRLITELRVSNVVVGEGGRP